MGCDVEAVLRYLGLQCLWQAINGASFQAVIQQQKLAGGVRRVVHQALDFGHLECMPVQVDPTLAVAAMVCSCRRSSSMPSLPAGTGHTLSIVSWPENIVSWESLVL